MTTTNREEALFFASASGKMIFGVLHHVESPSIAVVFCNPFGEEKQNCYRPFVAFSRYLAQSGVPSLRFDYTGSGDSEGSSEETTIVTQRSDLDSAIELARQKFDVQEIIIVGLRLGCTVSALAAEQLSNIRAIALLSPIPDGAAYWSGLLRKEQFASISMGTKARKKDELLADLQASGKIEIEAQVLGRELVDQLIAIDLEKTASRFKGKVLITSVAGAEAEHEPLQKLAARYRSIGCEVDVCFEEPQDFWSSRSMYDAYVPETTFARVAEWIQR